MHDNNVYDKIDISFTCTTICPNARLFMKFYSKERSEIDLHQIENDVR